MDETLARELGAEAATADGPASWWQLRLEVEGVRLDVAHHPPGGGGRRPWTAANFAATLAAMAFYETAARGEKPPHLYVRGHVHRPGDSYDAHPVRALVLPSWQLTTSYGYRIGGGANGADSTATLLRGGWYHIAVKRDSGTWTYYVNGNVDKANAGTDAPAAPTTFFYALTGHLCNRLSHVALYETALSDATVLSHFHSLRQ